MFILFVLLRMALRSCDRASLASLARPDAPYAGLPSDDLRIQASICSSSFGSTGDTIDEVSMRIGKSCISHLRNC